MSSLLSNRLELLSKYRGTSPLTLGEELMAQAVQSAIDQLPAEVAQAIETLASQTANHQNVEATEGAGNLVEYTAARLRFVRSRIEELQPAGTVRITVPGYGVFEFTRQDFETDFRNVVESRSYREAGYYHYATIPAKALKYRVAGPPAAKHANN
jgi:hypothetical protein